VNRLDACGLSGLVISGFSQCYGMLYSLYYRFTGFTTALLVHAEIRLDTCHRRHLRHNPEYVRKKKYRRESLLFALWHAIIGLVCDDSSSVGVRGKACFNYY
jgi:hypothetical protein